MTLSLNFVAFQFAKAEEAFEDEMKQISDLLEKARSENIAASRERVGVKRELLNPNPTIRKRWKQTPAYPVKVDM